MRYAELTLPGETASVPQARRFVEGVLDAWDLPELGWRAAVCVSELAANCALHARTEFTVELTEKPGGLVRVGVSDWSLRVPVLRSNSAEATTGRGLNLVEELAQHWGVDVTATGKTVWLELADAEELPGDAPEATVEELLAAFDDVTDEPGPADPVVAWAA